MSAGRGGFWNRAGRRSGGSRPHLLDIVVPETCTCGAELYPGLLERRLVRVAGETHELRLCPSCKYVVMDNGRWLTAAPSRGSAAPHE